jgi:hypothetical protein
MTEIDRAQQKREQTLLRIGAVCAILGAVVSVAAGIGFGNLTNESSTEVVLRYVSSYPYWYWPSVHLGFILGALLWVGALTAVASSFTNVTGWALGRLGAASVILGATIHIVDSSLNGFGVTALADVWAAAPASEQASLLRAGDTLLWILGGTWASVVSYFHGMPFILFGLAVVLDRSYPGWIGWVGFVGGAGSLASGMIMFLSVGLAPGRLYITFALVVSVWMVAMGVLMWRRASAAQNGEPTLEKEE